MNLEAPEGLDLENTNPEACRYQITYDQVDVEWIVMINYWYCFELEGGEDDEDRELIYVLWKHRSTDVDWLAAPPTLECVGTQEAYVCDAE